MTQNKSYGTTGIDSLEVGGNSPIGGMFTSAIASGKALADDGEVYDSVQTAVDNATGIVFVGEGTFNEAVTISTAGLTLQGSGYDTLIDGLNSGNAVTIDADNVTVRDLSVRTASGSGPIDGVDIFTTSATIQSVTVRESSRHGIALEGGSNHIVTNCTVKSADESGIDLSTSQILIDSCRIENCDKNGITRDASTNDNIISNTVIEDTGNNGIIAPTDSICIGCRVLQAGELVNDGSGSGILVSGTNGTDVIVANNRISDSDQTDLLNNGTGTVDDDNKTGASN